MNDIVALLKQVRAKRRELAILRESIAELRMMLMPSGIRYDKDKIQTSPKDKLSETVEKLVYLEKKYQKRIRCLSDDLAKVEELLEAMPTSEYREVLHLRYLAGRTKPMTWMEVAEKMGYSEDHVRGKLHGKALAEARKTWAKL